VLDLADIDLRRRTAHVRFLAGIGPSSSTAITRTQISAAAIYETWSLQSRRAFHSEIKRNRCGMEASRLSPP
jgi:hypothetical protein